MVNSLTPERNDYYGKKYRLTDESIKFEGKTLHSIQALKDFGDVKKGQLGGYVESEDNLSQEGNCWIYDNAVVMSAATVENNAKVHGTAFITGNASISDNVVIDDSATICGEANISEYSRVYENAVVFGCPKTSGESKIHEYAEVTGNAIIRGNAELYAHISLYDNSIIRNDAKLYLNNQILTINNYVTNSCSCFTFYLTDADLIKVSTIDNESYVDDYERLIKMSINQSPEAIGNHLKKALNLIKFVKMNFSQDETNNGGEIDATTSK